MALDATSKKNAETTTIATQREFAAHLRAPDEQAMPANLEDRRVQIYRDLVYKNIFNFISTSFPVFKKTSSDDYWHALIRDFLITYRAESPYFSDLAREFLEYLETRAAQALPEDPPYMLELAQYEWVEVGLLLADEEAPENIFAELLSDTTTEELLNDSNFNSLVLKAKPSLSALAWPLQYGFAVHKIGVDFVPDKPEPAPVFLIVYRNRNDRVKFMESNALTMRLLALCAEGGLTTQLLLEQLAREVKSESVESFYRSGMETLFQLARLDIVGFS